MFLSSMNYVEKENFLNLLINTAEIDGDFSDNEKNKISAYVNEMGLTLKDRNEYSLTNAEIISEFMKSTEVVKKSAFMELAALMYTDGLHESEEKLLKDVQEAFALPDGFKDEAINWYEEMTPIYKKGFELAGFAGAYS